MLDDLTWLSASVLQLGSEPFLLAHASEAGPKEFDHALVRALIIGIPQ